MSTTTAIKPTRETARTIVDLLSHGLVKGLGVQEPGKMCIEAVHRAALGFSHGDETPCKAPSVRALDIALNDSDWSSPKARAQGMKRLAVAGLGSIEIDETIFAKELALATIRQILPIALRASAKIHPDAEHQTALLKAANECEAALDLTKAESAARSAARSAAASAAESAAMDDVLSRMAEAGVQALIKAKSPGCKWLSLAA